MGHSHGFQLGESRCQASGDGERVLDAEGPLVHDERLPGGTFYPRHQVRVFEIRVGNEQGAVLHLLDRRV